MHNNKSWSIVALIHLHHYLVPVYHLQCWNTVEAQPKGRPHRHHLIYKCSLLQQALPISQYSECEFHSQLSPGIEDGHYYLIIPLIQLCAPYKITSSRCYHLTWPPAAGAGLMDRGFHHLCELVTGGQTASSQT